MAGKHYVPMKDGMSLSYRERQRLLREQRTRPSLPPKLPPLDEELIANLEAEVMNHEPDCICDLCFDLRVLKMEE